MSLRTRVSLIAVLALFLVTAAIWASAQVRQPPGIWVEPLSLVAPTVIAGSDLGFRIESTKSGIPVGKLVVRIDGRWIEAQVGSSGLMPADAR